MGFLSRFGFHSISAEEFHEQSRAKSQQHRLRVSCGRWKLNLLMNCVWNGLLRSGPWDALARSSPSMKLCHLPSCHQGLDSHLCHEVMHLPEAAKLGGQRKGNASILTGSLVNRGRQFTRRKFRISAAIERLNIHFPTCGNIIGPYLTLRESTMRGWVTCNSSKGFKLKPEVEEAHQLLTQGVREALLHSLQRQKDGNVWTGHPELKEEFKKRLMLLWEEGHVCNTVTCQILLRGLLAAQAPELLEHRPGGFMASRAFVQRFITNELQWSFRVPTTAADLPENWEELGLLFAGQLARAVHMHSLSPAFVVNFDQASCALVPLSKEKTYEKRGLQAVAITGRFDKRAITLVPCVAADGTLLPMQVIFHGTSKRSLPLNSDAMAEALRRGWDLQYTHNHWSSLDTLKAWCSKILYPYYVDTCAKEGKVVGKQKMVLILDCWSVHTGEEFRDYVKVNMGWILLLFVPAECTSKLQPCDLIVQRLLKAGVQRGFQRWATEEVTRKVKDGVPVGFMKADLSIGVLRVKALENLLTTYDEMSQRAGMLKGGWEDAGLLLAWDPNFYVMEWTPEMGGWDGMCAYDPQIHGDLSVCEPEAHDLRDDPWDGDLDTETVLMLCAGYDPNAVVSQSSGIDLNELPAHEASGDDLDSLGADTSTEVLYPDTTPPSSEHSNSVEAPRFSLQYPELKRKANGEWESD